MRGFLWNSTGGSSMSIARIMASAAVLAATFISSTGAAAAQDPPTYSVVSRIAGSGSAWDYAVVDEKSKRFYLAQQGVTALDLTTGN